MSESEEYESSEDFLEDLAAKGGEHNATEVDLRDPYEQKLPCGVSKKEIDQMKEAGISKPDFIPWAEWNGPKKLSHRHMLIAQFLAAGWRQKDICEKMQITQSRLSMIANSELMKQEVKRVREVQFHASGLQQTLDTLAPAAVQVLGDLVTDPKARGAHKLKAAQEILDRTKGKPLQQVEHSGSLVKDMFQYITMQDQKEKEIQQPKPLPVVEVDSVPIETTESPETSPSPENTPTNEAAPIVPDDTNWFEENI
jgi:hypothetical protein